MAQTVLARNRRLALGHDAKGADRRQCPDIVTIELVPVASVEHELAVLAPRQFEVCGEDVPRTCGAVVCVAFAVSRILALFARVLVTAAGRRTATDLNPLHVEVASVAIAISR